MVELTEWERTKLSRHAAATSLTYMGHHARGGLFQHEIEEIERWQALSEKLEIAEPQTVSVRIVDLCHWRTEWLEANDPQDGTDCVTPFDRYLYGSATDTSGGDHG